MMVARIMIEAKRLTCECRIDDHDCWACGRHASEFARDADGLQLAEVAYKDHGDVAEVVLLQSESPLGKESPLRLL